MRLRRPSCQKPPHHLAASLQSQELARSPSRRLHRSIEKMKGLRSQLHQLRTSFSFSALHYFDTLKSVSPSKSKMIQQQKPLMKQKSTGDMFSGHLDQISSKLKQAKKEISCGRREDHVNAVRNSKHEETVTTFGSKQSLTSGEVIRQKSKLTILTSAIQKPLNIPLQSHNPYTYRNIYYISQATKSLLDNKSNLITQHINQSIQMLLQYKLYKMNHSLYLQQISQYYLPSKIDSKKKTLVLDLDQTLIHCFQDQQALPDIRLNIKIEGVQFRIGFNIRPYVITFLKKMKKVWEIVVFTASHQIYADAILDQLDPDGELFDYRLYRQHCVELTPQIYLKDLSKLNRDLSSIVLVDNSAYSYAMQLDNGIPILPFYQGKDYQLPPLEEYLKRLQDCEDVRSINRSYFKLHCYIAYQDAKTLIEELYGQKEKTSHHHHF